MMGASLITQNRGSPSYIVGGEWLSTVYGFALERLVNAQDPRSTGSRVSWMACAYGETGGRIEPRDEVPSPV